MTHPANQLAPLVVTLATAATLTACGAGRKSLATTPGESAGAAAPSLLDTSENPRAEIEQLDQTAATHATELNLPLALDAETVAMSSPVNPPGPVPATCKQSAKQVCKDTCTVSSSICDAATRICELSKQLPGDEWAINKCQHNSKRCQLATERCCSCG